MAAPSFSPDASTPAAWIRRLWDAPWLWLAIIIPLFCVPLFVGLDRTDLENDEAIYSFAVETMLKDGDWLTPKSIPSETSAFLEKPPLKFWITYVPMRLGLLPQNEFGLRFMDAAMSAIAFLYVFAIGRKLAGPACGLVAVLLLFCHEALLYEHGLRSNNMESSTVLVYAAGVYHFLAWRSINPDVKRHVFAMALWFVVGFMTKFVAALFLPVILGLAALIRREDRGRLFRDWRTFALAAVVAVALIAPWFVYQYFERGPRLLDIMFGAHVLKRFTAYLDPAHLHPWHYYFTQIWTELGSSGTRWVIAISALLFLIQTWRRRWIEGVVIVLWFALPMAAISAGTSKLYHYAYPYLAPIALTGGWLVAVLAARVYRWIAAPVDRFASARDSMLPRWLMLPKVQAGLTIAGLLSLIVTAATAAFGRIALTFGATGLRSTSLMRPAIIASVVWLVGAPSHVLRAAVVAGLTILVLPLSAYQANVSQARVPHHAALKLRDCMRPLVAAEVAAGRKPPGVLVETRGISWIPFYYLRDFGPWVNRQSATNATIIEHLLIPDEFRLVLLPRARYEEIATLIAANRSGREERQAGLTTILGDTLVLPGPYAACGESRVRLHP